jgi:hypothetical protein
MSLNFKPPRGTLVNKSHPIARGLVACWLLNEGGGNTLFDVSGNGKNLAKNSAATWVIGEAGFGYDQDANESTSIADFHVNNITLETRVIHQSARNGNTAYNGIVAKWVTGSDCWFLGANAGGFSFWVSTSGGDYGIDTGTFTNGVLFHEVGTYDGETSRLYVDGLELSTNATPSGNLNTYTTATWLGRQQSSTARWFPGTIFYVRIWDRALTAVEVRWLYEEPYAMFERLSPRGFLYVAPAAGDIVILRRRRSA